MTTKTTKPAGAKQPQDHKQKQAEFTFTGADGKEYVLPPAAPIVESAPLRVTRDMIRADRAGDDEGQFLAVLDLLDLLDGEHAAARDAVLDLPTEAGMEVAGAWLSASDGVEASAGESSGSED